MFSATLTCHQVMPQFLDFVYPFGERVDAEDCHFSAFMATTRTSKADSTLEIPELDWSGRKYEMCFNLRSVESAQGTPEWPWSVRQTAVYHSFDIISGRTIWIIVKGNNLMRNRIQKTMSTSESSKSGNIRDCDLLPRSFCATIETHLIFCEWARENWRWYINFLEKEFRGITGMALHVTVEHQSAPEISQLMRSETAPNPPEGPKRTFSWSTLSQGLQPRRAVTFEEIPSATAQQDSNDREMTVAVREKQHGNDPIFSFDKLQAIQNLQEKANETTLILTMNIKIIQKLRQQYRDLASLEHWPEKFEERTYKATERFQRAASEVISDMEMQRSRLENLGRILADRKALVSPVQQYFYQSAKKG